MRMYLPALPLGLFFCTGTRINTVFGTWNKICLILMLALAPLTTMMAQTGSSSNPFTSIGQAASVTTTGIYYFNLGGTQFSTQVNSIGELLVAMSYGGSTGPLVQTASMTNLQSGILTAGILSSLSGIASVHITSNGPIGINLISVDPGVISKLQNNTTLDNGTSDNVLNSSWTGTGDLSASCVSDNDIALQDKIVHPCGNVNGLHWIPANNSHMDSYNTGELPASGYLQLWAKGTPGTAQPPNNSGLWTDNNSGTVYGSVLTNKVGIGTTDTKGYTLAVNGPAIFTKAVVKIYGNWPDYVFDSGYRLPPLMSVNDFIKKNGHLPGIPSAETVRKGGIDLGGNQAALLAKIEQLTLYSIEQDRRQREQQHVIRAQGKLLDAQQATLFKMQKRLNDIEGKSKQNN